MTAPTFAAPLADESRIRRLASVYRSGMRMGVLTQIQYRATNYFFLIGMVTEPVVYLVVWSTIARGQGGSIDGYTAGTFAA